MPKQIFFNTNSALSVAKDLTLTAIENGYIRKLGSPEESAKEIATFLKTLATELNHGDDSESSN